MPGTERSPGTAAARRLVASVALLVAVLAVGYLLVEELGGARRDAGPAAVLFAPPPGYAMAAGGELSRAAAAQRLAAELAARPGEARVGLHFTSAGAELFWLADRTGAQGGALTELAAGPTGTRVETRYPGALAERLAWGAERGRLDLPGAPPAESRNLYH